MSDLPTDITISEWQPGTPSQALVEQLARLLHESVDAGASVSFFLPFSMEDAEKFWSAQVLPAVMARTTLLLLAEAAGEVLGVVLLDLAVPPNQTHRAEVKKLLVFQKARRRGIGRSLMHALAEVARREGRTLLTLDTRTGDAAEPLYLSLGYVLAGVIPRFARSPGSPALDGTSIMYKEI